MPEPTYTKDVSVFKKWLPVKTWFKDNPVVITASAGSIAGACAMAHSQVNSGFVYMRDGLNDIWYTPTQFLKAKGGDCEDFCIFKMYRLGQLGVPLSKCEIVICTDKLSREYHAVLRVFSGTSQYILDNQSVKLLDKASFNKRYAPIYAIGLSGWRICTD